jgi:hypothetical protein
MKSTAQVRTKLKNSVFKHKKKYLESQLKQKPGNCKWNSKQKYLHRGTGELRVIGMCMYSVEDPSWDTDICESDATAQQCSKFCPMKDKEQLTEEFEELLDDQQFVSTHCKDLAALRWVLNGEEHADQPTKWRRFLGWFGL